MSDNLDFPAPLPCLNQRWTVQRKSALVFAVRSGRISIEEACRVYKLSVDEFLAWERNLDRYGIPGLRTTRYQIYPRGREKSRASVERFGIQLGPSPDAERQGYWKSAIYPAESFLGAI